MVATFSALDALTPKRFFKLNPRQKRIHDLALLGCQLLVSNATTSEVAHFANC